jgi:FixJ family two-component response regulator
MTTPGHCKAWVKNAFASTTGHRAKMKTPDDMTIQEILEELPNLTQKERSLLRDLLNQEVAQHAGTKARTLESLIDESVRSLKKYKKL